MASKRKVLDHDSSSKRQKKEMPHVGSETEGSATKLGKGKVNMLIDKAINVAVSMNSSQIIDGMTLRV